MALNLNPGGRTALTLIVLGGIGLLFGFGSFAHSLLGFDEAQAIVLPATDERSVENRVAAPAVLSPVQSERDQSLVLVHDLESNDQGVQQNAIAELRALALTDPKSLASDLPQWVAPLLYARDYQDLNQFALAAILDRPFDPVTVAAAQRARVLTLIAQQNYPQALSQAKSYYNIAPLAQSGDAVELLSRLLRQTCGESVARHFNLEQRQSTGNSNLLDTIRVDPEPYRSAIQALRNQRNGKREYSHNSLMAQANLLLLSDRQEEAKVCFQAAFGTEQTANRNLRQALEGVAQVIRAQKGNVAAANAFISGLRKHPELARESFADAAAVPQEEVRIAAQQIPISDLPQPVLPELEQQRARQEENIDNSAILPKVETGFEGSTPVYVAIVSPTHLVVEITTAGFRDWFMFRVHGVAGKTIRIDITGAYKNVPEWAQKNWSLNPVYTDAQSLDDLATYVTGIPTMQATANNGPELPGTSGQSWHYVADVWNDDYTLSFVQHFESDSVYIAMRVPRTPLYNEHFLQQLNPLAKVVEIGRSANGRRLLAAQIGNPSAEKPCILLYAQEHADEPDAGWVAQGAIEYLVSDAPGAAQLRNKCTFLVIPMLDPDAVAAGLHQSMISSFLVGHTTPESIAYANWFQNWIGQGNRVDLVVDLHNIQSGEGPHIFCPLIEATGLRGTLSLALHRMLLENMQDAGYGMQANPLARGWMPDRLGGWLSHYYGPLSIAYEVNSQAPERHLTLAELKTMGAVFVETAGEFFATQNGDAALTETDRRRAQRAAGWIAYSANRPITSAIDSEADFVSGHHALDTISQTEKAIP